jgi:hypothetical protein|tara:strand:+ start:38 stop:226 length:189 start_codon:yes stop_codon:yes gene_type:complete
MNKENPKKKNKPKNIFEWADNLPWEEEGTSFEVPKNVLSSNFLSEWITEQYEEENNKKENNQ